MRDFPAIERNTAPTDTGFQFVVNARYHIKGELGRRMGVDKQTPTGTGFGMMSYGAPAGGDYVLGVDASNGNLTLVAV